MGSSASPGPTTGEGKTGTACPWKCSTQNIHGKRQHFSPPGELAWKGKEGGKRKREAPDAGVGIRAHGALSCSTLHPGWEYSGADPGLILTLSSSSQPRNNIPPNYCRGHTACLQNPERPERAPPASLNRVEMRAGPGSGVGAPQPRSGIIVGQDYGAITVPYPWLMHKCSEWQLLVLPASTIPRADCCLWKASGNSQLAGKAGRASVAARWRREGAGLGACKGMVSDEAEAKSCWGISGSL